MIYIETDNTGRVTLTHYRPDQLPDTHNGYLVESIPSPEHIEGKIPVMYCRNGAIVYEYIDEPPMPEEPEIPDYIPEPMPDIDEQVRELVLDTYNARVDISNAEALKRPLLAYGFSTYIGKPLKSGQIVSHNDVLYRVRQNIPVVLANQSPGLSTAALYEAIEVEAAGTENDPIPYVPPMELSEGKYYTQNNVKYLCVRDTGTAISHDLAEVTGIYVEPVN